MLDHSHRATVYNEVRRFLIAAAAAAAAALIAIDLGLISLLVWLFGLQVVSAGSAGVLLILIAAGFFAAEVVAGGRGALALAGAGSFAVGALMLFDPAGDASHISLPVALSVAAALAIAAALAATKVVRARRAAPATAQERIVGRRAQVRTPLDPVGLVFVEGELWQARSTADHVVIGDDVVVERISDGLILTVAPASLGSLHASVVPSSPTVGRDP